MASHHVRPSDRAVTQAGRVGERVTEGLGRALGGLAAMLVDLGDGLAYLASGGAAQLQLGLEPGEPFLVADLWGHGHLSFLPWTG